MALEKSLEMGNTAVINVFIGPLQPPELRVGRKGTLHVLVHERLQVDPERPIRTNHDIGADARVGRHIPAGIVENDISGIVADLLRGAVKGRIDKPVGKVFRHPDLDHFRRRRHDSLRREHLGEDPETE